MHRVFISVLLVSSLPALFSAEISKTPVDYVKPHIGGVSHLLQPTLPFVGVPYGMLRVVPITNPGISDPYLADKIYGFPVGGAIFMPTTGPLVTDPDKFASEFDRDFETVTPYYNRQILDRYDIHVEWTAAKRAAIYRFLFPASSDGRVLASPGRDGEVTVAGRDAVSGVARSHDANTYFYAVFSAPFMSSTPYGGAHPGVALEFGSATRMIQVRAAMSYISAEQARKNLEAEIPAFEFDKIKATARAAWNKELSKLSVEGGTEKQRTIFYTALWRSLDRPYDITEEGGVYYSGYDHKVHNAEGHPFYVNDNFWDTHRSLHPLQTLLDPQRQVDMVRSLIRMYEQSGWLATVPTVGGDRGVMIGHHATPFIVDTYMKGYRDFDVAKAYEGIRKNATEATLLPWRRGPLTSLDRVYLEKGFFPSLGKGETETVKDVYPSERRQAVSVTLENAMDDWAVGEFAKALGKTQDAEQFAARGKNYRNLFDSRIGFMAPKTADGNWVPDFDPVRGGGNGGRDYFAECNSWVYTFHVQHDPQGLIALYGDNQKFTAKLDELFVAPLNTSKFVFLGQFPDMTGLIGNYPQGNEPAFHIPYLYNYAGQPWKAQFRLRQILNMWYDDGPLGIPGDDDGGATSSWYVLSAMGFYQVAPGRPVYDLGSPIFSKVRIARPNGKEFTIIARGCSPQNKYIQSAELNGKSLNGPWFQHADLDKGGTLILQMGPHPNKKWGAQAD